MKANDKHRQQSYQLAMITFLGLDLALLTTERYADYVLCLSISSTKHMNNDQNFFAGSKQFKKLSTLNYSFPSAITAFNIHQ